MRTAQDTHGRSVALMKFLSAVSRRLGVAEHVYVVGGAVRNWVIGQPIKDIDCVFDSLGAGAGRDSAWFAKAVKDAIPAITNLTTNQYGVAILSVSESWMLDGHEMQSETIEIANARKESYGGAEGKGYKPHMVEPATIEEDLLRREFTFNCMAGDTLIPTEHGILRLDQIASREGGDHQDIHLTVVGQDGPAVAVGWQYSGFAPTLRVTTEWGHSFSCTHHHPVLVLRGHDHEWVQADHLEEGDLLCVPVRSIVRRHPLPLNLPDPMPLKRGALKAVRKPAVMTPELAFVLGCVVAEGSNTHKRVSFSNSDPALISRYAECFQTTFGFLPSRNKVVEKGTVRILRGVKFVANADGYDIYADSKVVVGWLEDLGLYCDGAKDDKSASHHKVVPWSVLQADEQCQWAFLAAYLEGDGSIRPNTGRITFCSASPHVRQQLQVLLGTHGILSKVKDRFVYVNAVDSALLWKKIQPWTVTKGFDYTQRDTKARNRYGIPADYLRGVFASRVQDISREPVRKVQRLLHDAYARGDFDGFLSDLKTISPNEHAKLQRLFSLGYQYVAVTSVEDAGEQDVFDISMAEGVEPAFVANGVIVHNTLLWRMLDLADGPDKAEILDLTGTGKQHLDERTLRTPVNPDKTFSDDPTRMLRAIKFVAKYGFRIPPDVAQSIRRNAPSLTKMPWDAIRKIVVDDILEGPAPRRSVELMQSLGLSAVLKEMLHEEPGFAAALGRSLNEHDAHLLLDLLDQGWVVRTPISFLDRAGQLRLREILLENASSPDFDRRFVEALKKPSLDQQRLFAQYAIPPKDRQAVVQIARKALLADPHLVDRPHDLLAQVEEELGRRYPSPTTVRVASRFFAAMVGIDTPNDDK